MSKADETKVEPIRLLLKPEEAAASVGCCKRTLRNAVRAGALRDVKIGRVVRYKLTDLASWVDALQTRRAA